MREESSYVEDLNTIKAFITDVAGLIRQGKVAQTLPELTSNRIDKDEVLDKPFAEGEETPVKEKVPASTPTVMDKGLEREIAHIENHINRTELNLRNGYIQQGDELLESGESLAGLSPVESYHSTVASTAFGGDAYECNSNDYTVTNALSQMNTPVGGKHFTWHSGFETPSHNIHLDGDLDDKEVDLNVLHSRLVSLDIHSYMCLVERVLDERVRMELNPVD